MKQSLIVFVMSNLSFDYSKWDNIDLSDDEADSHPNLDTGRSLVQIPRLVFCQSGLNIKVKRAQRERKMEEYEQQRKQLLEVATRRFFASLDEFNEKFAPIFPLKNCLRDCHFEKGILGKHEMKVLI